MLRRFIDFGRHFEDVVLGAPIWRRPVMRRDLAFATYLSLGALVSTCVRLAEGHYAVGAVYLLVTAACCSYAARLWIRYRQQQRGDCPERGFSTGGAIAPIPIPPVMPDSDILRVRPRAGARH